ncbi:hypothetical protein WH292_08630 [Enterobacter sp. MYb186]
MNIMDEFEKEMEIDNRVNLLKSGAKYLGPDFKISTAFSKGNVPASLASFYQSKDLANEAVKAIEWWFSLTPEKQRKYDR